MSRPSHRASRRALSRSRSAWLRGRGASSLRRRRPRPGRATGASAAGLRAARTRPSSRSASRSPRSIRKPRSSFEPAALLDLARDLPAGAVGRRAQPLDAGFRLAGAGVEARDQFLQRRAVALQHAERAFQPQRVKQRRRQQRPPARVRGPIPCRPLRSALTNAYRVSVGRRGARHLALDPHRDAVLAPPDLALEQRDRAAAELHRRAGPGVQQRCGCRAAARSRRTAA